PQPLWPNQVELALDRNLGGPADGSSLILQSCNKHLNHSFCVELADGADRCSTHCNLVVPDMWLNQAHIGCLAGGAQPRYHTRQSTRWGLGQPFTVIRGKVDPSQFP